MSFVRPLSTFIFKISIFGVIFKSRSTETLKFEAKPFASFFKMNFPHQGLIQKLIAQPPASTVELPGCACFFFWGFDIKNAFINNSDFGWVGV